MDVAILAGRVPHEDRLYVIGPFAERLSFASQQRRALSLVCAIDDEIKRAGDGDGLAGKRACIVGAGLAGLTCSVGLAAFKCDSWILESERTALAVNQSARHREIHPSINFWPREDVVVTTMLPFLNWHQDRCDLILTRLLKEWLWLEKKHGALKGITLGCTVEGVCWNGTAWEITTSGKSPPVQGFDIVIFATGYGVETVLPQSDSPSYWNAEGDKIEELRKRPGGTVRDCIISGTGDGGLIEVLRLLFSKFQAGKVNYGTSGLFESEHLRRRLRAIETKVRLRVSDEILREPHGSRPAGFPLSDVFKDEIAEYLWEAYFAASPDLADSFRRSLAEQRTAIPKVVLIGERAVPTEYTSSPYHRLLIVHAIREGWLEYQQVPRGGIVIADDPQSPDTYPVADDLCIKLKKVTFTSVRRITGERHQTVFDDGSKMASYEAAFFLNRHGTDSPLEPIFKKVSSELLTNVRKRQSLYADQDWISMDQAREMATKLKLPSPGHNPTWLEQSFKGAQRFFLERYGLDVREEYADGVARFILYKDAGGGRGWSDEHEAGPIPELFYGIPVDSDDVFEVPNMSWTGHGRA
ncbi:MAG TPA: hypothetical protein VGB54_02385 [Allosphingosinicella sp.]|jgi:hypothetical protein